MKTTMKKIAAYLLAFLLVFQMTSAFAGQVTSGEMEAIGMDAFRDILEVTSDVSILPVNGTVQLKATEGYYDLKWSCDPEGIAEVDENGLVKALAPGQVKITAEEDGYRDSVTIKVIGVETQAEGEDPDSGKMIIVINAGKDKYTYDGTVKVSTFTAVSNDEGFDSSLVELDPEKYVEATDCSTYPVKYNPADFTYNGSRENVEFIVSDGWIQIKPVTVTVTANKLSKKQGEEDPELTVTIAGRVSEDDPIEYQINRMPGEEVGTWEILVNGEELQTNYRVKYENSSLEILPNGLSGSYLLGLKQYSALLTATETKIDNENRLKAIKYEEAGNGLIYPTDINDYWTFAIQPSGKYYISSGGRYLNMQNKKLTLSGTPQELTVEDMGDDKIAIRNDDIVRVNLKSNSIDKGFQGSDWNKTGSAEANETFTLYRGLFAPSEGQGIVHFDGNSGGKVKAPSPVIEDIGSTITLPNVTEKNNGADFLGWAVTRDITQKNPATNNPYWEIYKAGSQYTLKSTVTTLYAVWNNKNLKVRFGLRKDGQIQDEPNQYDVKGYCGHLEIQNNAINGYWVIDVDPSKPVEGNHIVNDVTANLKRVPTDQEILDALKEEPGVDFDPETQYIHWYVMKWAGSQLKVDGVVRSKSASATTVMYQTNVPAEERTDVANMPAGFETEAGTEIEAGANQAGTVMEPTRDGFLFDGWNTAADGSGTAYSSNDTLVLVENVTLYAQWTDTRGRTVTITSDWPEGKLGLVGDKVTLTASVDGFVEGKYRLQWQYTTDPSDPEAWTDVPGAEDVTYTYVLDTITTTYTWRVVAIDLK